jgi:hypothetical protein
MFTLTWNWCQSVVQAAELLHAGLDLVQVDKLESCVCRAGGSVCFPGAQAALAVRLCEDAIMPFATGIATGSMT